MQRIKLGKPYDDYINQQIESGLFASATEVLRDALRPKMGIGNTSVPKKTVLELVKEGEESVKAGRLIEHSPDLLKNIFEKAKENARNGKQIPDYIKPNSGKIHS
jgi:putative addiction module CopG family antidote